MGILRVYLALAVLVAHSRWTPLWPMHDARQAVQIFYIISGFYMALVLTQRYNSPKQFYKSRLLRIFPAYWTVLGCILVWCVFTGIVFHRWLQIAPFRYHPWTQNGIVGLALAGLTNLGIFGQDWILFLQHDVGRGVEFTSHASLNPNPLYFYMVLPQAWSVGLELTFYLLVPFLNRLRTLHLLSLFLGTLVLRISAFHILGYDHDPWTYQFFPFEIGLFILGMLGYRFQQRFGNRWLRIEWDGNRWKYFLAVVILLGILVGQAALTERLCRIVGVETGRFITYIFWSLEVGFLFRLFGNFRWDRILGEFSFPIYLIHMAVLDNLLQISELHPLSLQTICFSCIAISGTLSVLLYLFVIRRWDEKRHSLSGFHANG